MQFSREQERALSAVAKWIESRDKPFFYLAGYAGTGKTTLACHLAESVDGVVLYAAYTGKAALVMRQKGCASAGTIHSLIYCPKAKSLERLERLEREMDKTPLSASRHLELLRAIAAEKANLKRPAFSLNVDSALRDADLLVVDECSMVDKQVGADLISFGTPILVLGDPGQLPPVFGAGYFTGQEPDFMLTEIHRQARDNPIIEMATLVREGKALPHGPYGESAVIARTAFNPDTLGAEVQVLVGLNATRQRVNLRRRRALLGEGLPPLPVVGDRLVCLRNNHDIGILNGGIWQVEGVETEEAGLFGMRLRDEFGKVTVTAHAGPFRGEEVPHVLAREAEMFDYGYGLTVHKAQGSQWDDVLLVDESSRWGNGDARRHLYTGITRAAKRITVIR